jgi:hypothetical protein
MSEIRAEELRKVLAAIVTTPHRYIGIRPIGSVPAESPCFLLSEPSLHALMYQLDNARECWPEADQWELVASDLVLTDQPPDLPPGCVVLRSPVPIATLAAPVMREPQPLGLD